jgi:xanthine dehydrogenase accessory factor
MDMIATSPADVLRFLLARSQEGLGTVLVTLTGIEKGSSRAIGSQMAVAEDGRYVGSFSGGCIEAAVVGEALDCLRQDRATLVRFGLDSRYIDIRLPCGGGVDLYFNPRPDPATIAGVLSSLDAREPARLSIAEGGVRAVPASADEGSGWRGDGFEVVYVPPLRIVAFGQGEDLTAFARLAHRFGADVTAFSPSQTDLDLLSGENIEGFELVSRNSLPAIRSDAWTAIVFLFHDHDWEETLIPHALNLQAFYFGAVGSRRTHQARLEMLRLASVPERLQRALRGPVGLIPATRDPATLALSILAEVVSEFQRIVSPVPDEPLLAAT